MKSSKPSSLTPRAIRAFDALAPERQALVLYYIGALSTPRIPQSRLLGSAAQREAVRVERERTASWGVR